MEPKRPTFAFGGRFHVLLFAVLFVVSALLRMSGLSWGLPTRYHCDERRVVQGAWRYATGQTTRPTDNVYAPLFSYLSRGAHLISGGRLTATQAGTARFLRGVSATASSLTPPIVFWAATALFGMQGGLVAGLCLACAPGAIREAHFATVDSFLTLALVMVLAAGVLVIRRPKSKLWILLPVSLGLALAVKISALPALLALVLLVPKLSAAGTTRRMVLAPLLLAAVFTLLAWHMVIDPRHYAFWIGKSGLDRTGVAMPYSSLQFHRPQPFGGLVSLLWMAGPLLLAGGMVGALEVLRVGRHRPMLLLAAIPPFVGSFLECFTSAIPFVRTALPLVPLLALASGAGFVFMWNRRRMVGAVLAGILIVGTGIAGVRYAGIYREADTRIQAERWLSRRWKPGEIVLLDGSDDLVMFPSIPLKAQRLLHHPAQHALQKPVAVASLPCKDRLLFRVASWGAVREKDRALLEAVREPPPIPEPGARRALLRRQIREATWIVTTGTEQTRYRAHSDTFRPEIEFYDSLFSGEAGFDVVATFSAGDVPYPPFLAPEPSWFFFDHPRVIILKRALH